MATGLQNLPNEILTIISNYVDATWSENELNSVVTKPDLCALALTCRRISTLSRSFIYRNIRVDYGPRYLNPMRSASEGRVELLLRTWRDNPTWYLNCLHQVSWSMWTTNNTVRDEFFDCIAQSQSLHELNLLDCRSEEVHRLVASLHPPSQEHGAPDSEPGHSRFYTGLRVLRIRPNRRFFNYSDIVLNLCTTPCLQHLEVGGIGISTSISLKDLKTTLHELSQRQSNQSNPNSGLESLHISRQSFIDVIELASILKVCSKNKSLKRLQIPPPAPSIKYDDGRRDRFPDTNQRFSPRVIAMALSPIADTLQALSLTDPEIIFYARSDGTRLNLSQFSVLRVLKVSSFVLVGGHNLSLPYYRDENRRSQSAITVPPPTMKLWEILPPNLEELHVAFDGLEGIFHSMKDLDFSTEEPFHVAFAGLWDQGPGSAVQVQRALWWAAELLEQRGQTHSELTSAPILQSLRRIDLEECHDTQLLLTSNHSEIRLKSQSLRAHHPRVFRGFDKLGVRVDVRIYMRSEWPVL